VDEERAPDLAEEVSRLQLDVKATEELEADLSRARLGAGRTQRNVRGCRDHRDSDPDPDRDRGDAAPSGRHREGEVSARGKRGSAARGAAGEA